MLFGALITVPLVYALGVDGVVLAVVTNAALGLLMSWWYSRKVRIEVPHLTIYPIVRRLTGLHWSAQNVKSTVYIALTACAFVGCQVLPPAEGYVAGSVMIILCTAYSIREI